MKNKEISLLLEKVLKYIEEKKEFDGLCVIFFNMFMDDRINDRETTLLKDYLFDNKPNNLWRLLNPESTYLWSRKTMSGRKRWIRRHIKKNK